MTKLALLTGGSRGIGRATADMLRERGWDVLAPTRAELDMQDPRKLVEYVDSVWRPPAEKSLNALVLNAGVWHSSASGGLENYFDNPQIRILQGHMYIMLNLLNILQERIEGGVVIGVSSTQAFQGTPETAPYSVAKAGLINLMGAFAKYYEGVRFNSVCPSWTDTDMGKQVKASGGVSDPNATPQPPEAVAAEIVRLIESDDNGRVMSVVDSVVEEWAWGPKRE